MLSRASEPLRRAARLHRAPLAAASTLLLVVSAVWAMQAVAHVDRVQATTMDKAWSEQGTFAYTVPVLKDSPMFRNGTVLGMGEPAYFRSVSPVIDASFDWQLAEPATSDAQALGSLAMVVRDEDARGRALWTLEFPVANASSDAGQALHLAGRLDLPGMEAQVRQGLQALGIADTKLTWQVVARVAFTFHAPWGEVRNTSSFVLPLAFDGPMYTLPGADDARSVRLHGEPHVTVRESRAGLAALLASPLLLAGLGAGLAGLGLLGWSSRPPPSGAPGKAEVSAEREAAKFATWITEVEGPLEPGEDWGAIVDLNSLADLVDMAAETRTRVLLDKASRTYYVLTPKVCYRFSTHPWLHASAEPGKGAAGVEEPPERWPKS